MQDQLHNKSLALVDVVRKLDEEVDVDRRAIVSKKIDTLNAEWYHEIGKNQTLDVDLDRLVQRELHMITSVQGGLSTRDADQA